MKRIYIAGKLNDKDAIQYLKNVHQMMVYAERIKQYGYAIFVPCLDLLMGIAFGYYEYEDYANNNLEWVNVSDYLFVCPNSENSVGVKKEINRARSLNIPIIYKISELPEWKKKNEVDNN